MKMNPEKTISFSMLVISAGFLLWYVFVGYKTGGFHSDSASKVMLAREMFEYKNFFPRDWYFGNGDIRIFSAHTLVFPLLYFFPAGYSVYAISSLIISIFILLGIWHINRLAGADTTRNTLVVACIAAGISSLIAENLFGQVSYGMVLLYDCFIIYFGWNLINPKCGYKKVNGIGLITLLIITFWSNPQRATIYYLLPLCISAVSYFYYEKAKKRVTHKSQVYVLILIVLGCALGILLHLTTIKISGMHNVMGVGGAKWLPYELMSRNAGSILKGYLAAFDALPDPQSNVLSVSGIYTVARIAAAVTLFVLIAYSVWYSYAEKFGSNTFLIIFSASSLLLLLFVYITTSVPDMNFPIQSFRYLLPPILLLMVIALCRRYDFESHPLLAASQYFVIFILLTSPYSAYIKQPSAYLDWAMPVQRVENATGLVKYLEGQGLKYGYASYWNASSLSVLSGEKVIVRPIEFKNGLPIPFRWLSAGRWYQPSAWAGETFILLNTKDLYLNPGENSKIDLERMAYYQGKPSRVLSFETYVIYVYPKNISVGMPEWDPNFETPIYFPPTKYSLGQVGKLTHDADAPIMVAEKGEKGPLTYGPYINLGKGEYVATFEVFAPYNSKGAVNINIAAPLDNILYAEKLLNGSSGPQELDFQVDRERIVEFRTYSLGNERVVLKGFSLRRK